MSVLKIKDEYDQWQTVTTWGDYYILGFTATLSSAAWSSNSQTVINNNFVASGYNYIITPVSADLINYTNAQIYADDVIVDNQITFHCSIVPTSDLSVNVMKVKTA